MGDARFFPFASIAARCECDESIGQCTREPPEPAASERQTKKRSLHIIIKIDFGILLLLLEGHLDAEFLVSFVDNSNKIL